MEAGFVLCCLSGASAFLAGSAAGAAFAGEVRKGRMRGGARTDAGAPPDGPWARRVRNGWAPLLPLAAWLLKRGRVRAFVQEAAWLAAERGHLTTPEALVSLCLPALAALAAVAGLVAGSVVAAFAVAACAVALAVVVVRSAQDKRRSAVREAVPDALRAMGVCFQAGLSLLQTFQQVAKETDGPLRTLFARGSHLLETGRTSSEALDVFRSGAQVPELAFVAVALDVQHQTGGSISQVLDAARDTVESELELERSLHVQTAQARLSARIVSVMPFVLVALFSLVSEGFLEPFFNSAAGVALLLVALSMQAAGVLAVRRMLRVEVDR